MRGYKKRKCHNSLENNGKLYHFMNLHFQKLTLETHGKYPVSGNEKDKMNITCMSTPFKIFERV